MKRLVGYYSSIGYGIVRKDKYKQKRQTLIKYEGQTKEQRVERGGNPTPETFCPTTTTSSTDVTDHTCRPESLTHSPRLGQTSCIIGTSPPGWSRSSLSSSPSLSSQVCTLRYSLESSVFLVIPNNIIHVLIEIRVKGYLCVFSVGLGRTHQSPSKTFLHCGFVFACETYV